MKTPAFIFNLFCGLLLLNACQQSGQNDQAEAHLTDTASHVISEPAVLADTAIAAIYSNYLQLKDALVASDAATAQSHAATLQSALQQVEGCETTAAIAGRISAESALAGQREDFTVLSADIIALLKGADLIDGKIFVQYCPMANENEGGYWLASENQIRNPYYGSKMMACGEVKETLAAK